MNRYSDMLINMADAYEHNSRTFYADIGELEINIGIDPDNEHIVQVV
jgi:hypothetical protein